VPATHQILSRLRSQNVPVGLPNDFQSICSPGITQEHDAAVNPPSLKPFLKRRYTVVMWRMRPVPVVFLRIAFWLQLSAKEPKKAPHPEDSIMQARMQRTSSLFVSDAQNPKPLLPDACFSPFQATLHHTSDRTAQSPDLRD